MKNNVKFGDWFSWELHDDYVDEAMNDSTDIAATVDHILSDNNKMKEYNLTLFFIIFLIKVYSLLLTPSPYDKSIIGLLF